MKVWRYVLATDNGTAPNYDPPCLTLALCKPKIRHAATAGDLVIAFAGRSLDPNPDAVVWAGVVTDAIDFAEYWRSERFQAKKGQPPQVLDNIYEPDPGLQDGFKQHPHAYHDATSKERDLSGRFALAFDGPDVWVFRSSPPILPREFGLGMGSARRGHRVCQIDQSQWTRIREWLTIQEVPARRNVDPSGGGTLGVHASPGQSCTGHLGTTGSQRHRATRQC